MDRLTELGTARGHAARDVERAKRDLARAEAEYAARDLAYQRYLTCWCGGAVGTREPGDANGLGCQANLYHVWDFQQVSEGQWPT